jgi:hypothetical protein
VSDLLALRAVFPVWDAVGHGTERYPHDLDGVVRVPRHVAVHLLRNGGYVIDEPSLVQLRNSDPALAQNSVCADVDRVERATTSAGAYAGNAPPGTDLAAGRAATDYEPENP